MKNFVKIWYTERRRKHTMKITRGLQFYTGSREEKIEGFTEEFPYIASRAELNAYQESFVPWHWHKAVELFYIESGTLTYHTPGGVTEFPAGSGGMVNSNVLHMTKFQKEGRENLQLLHIFDPVLIAGNYSSRIGEKYVTPLMSSSELELIALSPENSEQQKILHMIRQAFQIPEEESGYELQIREALSEIWLELFRQNQQVLRKQKSTGPADRSKEQIKQMMSYIQENYAEKLTVSRIAAAAFVSERECYRIFRKCLQMTPTEYLTGFRIQTACRMLEEGRKSITEIALDCGMGSGSYFGKVFRKYQGVSPLAYRDR